MEALANEGHTERHRPEVEGTRLHFHRIDDLPMVQGISADNTLVLEVGNTHRNAHGRGQFVPFSTEKGTTDSECCPVGEFESSYHKAL